MRVYYTGDMANAPGWFAVAGDDPLNGVTLIEEPGGEGRRFSVHHRQIGDRYEGHCNPRFVTEEAYRAFRRGRQELTPIERSVLERRDK